MRKKLGCSSRSNFEHREISPIDSTEFRYVHKTIKKINPDVYVAPYVMIGGTDSKYLYAITRNVRC